MAVPVSKLLLLNTDIHVYLRFPSPHMYRSASFPVVCPFTHTSFHTFYPPCFICEQWLLAWLGQLLSCCDFGSWGLRKTGLVLPSVWEDRVAFKSALTQGVDGTDLRRGKKLYRFKSRVILLYCLFLLLLVFTFISVCVSFAFFPSCVLPPCSPVCANCQKCFFFSRQVMTLDLPVKKLKLIYVPIVFPYISMVILKSWKL